MGVLQRAPRFLEKYGVSSQRLSIAVGSVTFLISTFPSILIILRSDGSQSHAYGFALLAGFFLIFVSTGVFIFSFVTYMVYRHAGRESQFRKAYSLGIILISVVIYIKMVHPLDGIVYMVFLFPVIGFILTGTVGILESFCRDKVPLKPTQR